MSTAPLVFSRVFSPVLTASQPPGVHLSSGSKGECAEWVNNLLKVAALQARAGTGGAQHRENGLRSYISPFLHLPLAAVPGWLCAEAH